MGILRHADIRETLIYAPYSLEEGRAAISRLDEATISPSPSALPVTKFPAPAVSGLGEIKVK